MNLFSRIVGNQDNTAQQELAELKARAQKVTKLETTPELIWHHGYKCETHHVDTTDGWTLDLFRVVPVERKQTRKGHRYTDSLASTISSSSSVQSSSLPKNKGPVLIWHGLSTSSTIWVCNPEDSNANMALWLAEQGYDVWLGNTRGTRYSRHRQHEKANSEYWDYCIDDLPKDVEACVDHILADTHRDTLCYIGFSQGTAQMFAALSTIPSLNSKISSFVALAPAIKPKPFRCRPVLALASFTPNILFSILGKGAFMPIAESLRKVAPPTLYQQLISRSMKFLFGWDNHNFVEQSKVGLYSHIFGTCSIKTYVHWFQIILSGEFTRFNQCACWSPGQRLKEMILGRSSSPSTEPSSAEPIPLATEVEVEETTTIVETKSCCTTNKYPLHQITAPVHLFYGSIDLMTDIEYFKSNLPRIDSITKVDNYDHMCFIWAKDVKSTVWTKVLDILENSDMVKTSRQGQVNVKRLLSEDSAVDFDFSERDSISSGSSM